MARPREFDETKALDQALTVFWSKGFDGASITDLTEATGLARASLYAAFGDKEGLFRAAVQRYLTKIAAMVPAPSAAPSGAAWLRTFFIGSSRIVRGWSQGRGICTSMCWRIR